ncbi:MAG: MFS transporter [Acidimicrobiales bacterium]
MATGNPFPARRNASPGLLVAVLVFLAVESTAVASLGTPLLPTIEAVDHVSLPASQWALTITLLVGAVTTPLMGRLGDGRWRRQTTIGAVAVMLAGCVLSALPVGFAVFLLGRALQGVGFGLVPLATAIARDDLATERSRPAIVLIGITTAAGIGVGYPLVGLLAQYLGLYAPFWFAAALSALALVGAAAVLPESPQRPVHVDVAGVVLLGTGIAGFLLVLAEGPSWGWASTATLATGCALVVLLVAWVAVELRAHHPLIELRLLRRRPVLAANVTAFLVALGFYPLQVLVVRLVQTPTRLGYGFGAPVLVAGLMLTPLSLASFAASKVAARAARRSSSELVVAAGCFALIASVILFLFARSSYWEIGCTMALIGFGVGCVYAVNPLQITGGVPPEETGSAMSFYQDLRTVAYSIASALSATVLVAYIPRGHVFPTNTGFSAAALISIAVLVAALVASVVFVALAKRPEPAASRT